MVKMVDLNNYSELLSDFSKREFDILSFARKVDRRKVLPVCMINCINNLELQTLINEMKLESFLK